MKRKFINILIDMALKSKLPKKHGAILVRGNKVLRCGMNTGDFHAEASVLKYFEKGG